MKRHPLFAAGPALVLLAASCTDTHDLPRPEGAYVVQDRALGELSGLEASSGRADVLWGINDSGSAARLYRLGSRGEALGQVRVRGAWIRDPETLAVWHAHDRDWILIGDIGDNPGLRSRVHVHAVAEPAPAQTEVRIAWTLSFSYPDGPRNAEGMAVDHRNGDLLVFSKHDRPARLYRVPLSARETAGPVVAEFVAAVPGNGLDGPVTALDLTTDGGRMAVLTYRGVYLWERGHGEDWAQVLAEEPLALELPPLYKAEAIAFCANDEVLYVGSEGLPAMLLRISPE